MEEGLAMFCGAFMSPEDLAENDWILVSLVRWGSELPLSVVEDVNEFYDEDNATKAYVQGLSMTHFLLKRLGPQGLPRFLDLLREEGDVDEALETGWGFNAVELYDTWLEAVRERTRTPTPESPLPGNGRLIGIWPSMHEQLAAAAAQT